MRTQTILAAVAAAAVVPGCGFGGDSGELTIYSGREEELVAPLLDEYEEEEGVELEVRYGDTPALAATIAEEGDASPADVFFSQDAGALGQLQKEGLLAELPDDLIDEVEPGYRSGDGVWVGTSGRARVIAYSKEELEESDLPSSVLGLTDERWEGKVGWAPTNSSFQAFVTGLRKTESEDGAGEWLERMVANDAQVYESNSEIRDAIANGEIEVGLINHYYVEEAVAEEGPDYPVGIVSPSGGDAGALVNVAGAGVLGSSEDGDAATDFVRFLVSERAQEFFASETFEYPLAAGVESEAGLVPLDAIEQPDVDLTDLDDLEGTIELIEESGAL